MRVSMPEATPHICKLLAEMFEGHDIATRIEGEVVRFPTYPGRWASGVLLRRAEPSRVARFDLLLGLNEAEVICESVLGLGDTMLEQVEDAVRAAADSSAHAMMSAFFHVELCHGTVRESMRIGGIDRIVHLGPVTSRMGLPTTLTGDADISFLEEFQHRLTAYPLPPGTHWARLYIFRGAECPPTTEVLLDNEVCPGLQRSMEALYTSPPPNAFDVRVFMVIQDAQVS